MATLKNMQQLGWRGLPRWSGWGNAPWARNAPRYALAVLLAGAALLVRFHLERIFHHSDAYVMFLLAVIAANWLCGLGPCLVTLLLGGLAGTWFFAGQGKLVLSSANQWFDLGTYLVPGLVIAGYGWARRKAEDRLGAEVKQRQQAQEALRQAHGMLEQRVEERTLELQQSIQGMRELTYSIAHNLFAPLRATHGFAELLLARCGERLGPEGQDFARHTIEASARMGNLLDALLVYGRVASVEAPVGGVNTSAVLEQAISHVRRMPVGAGAKIETQRPLPPVKANAELLGETMFCLLHNAVKFVAPGVKPQVRVRADFCPEGVRLCVEDNGVGIPRQYHVEIFGAFNRLVPDDSSSTGMGLTIAQKAVERMHGQIGLESEPDHGSCFWVKLPKAE